MLGGTLWTTAVAACGARRAVSSDGPLRNIVVSCMENRSFDHYFGFAPQVQAAAFGPPAGYTQPDAAGRAHAPYELTRIRSADPPHQWDAAHLQWNGGQMDGFYRVAEHDNGDGNQSLPYYTARQLPFYYSLFDGCGLCANYFSSVLGGTLANRYYLMSGTSGGITSNGRWGYGVFDSRSWPIILDLLDEAGVTWKIYYVGFDDVNKGDSDNIAVFWTRYAHDRRTLGTKASFLRDLEHGDLPQVSWVIASESMGYDEHPPADVSVALERLRPHGVPAHVRRARRLLRPRGATADRRLRARHARAAVGGVALRPAWRHHLRPAGRPRLHPEADRAHVPPADAGIAQPPVRPRHADGPELPGARRARPAA
jgi:phospholipase C